MSADLQNIVYTAGEVLYLYNLSSQESRLLAENIPAEGKAKDDLGVTRVGQAADWRHMHRI